MFDNEVIDFDLDAVATLLQEDPFLPIGHLLDLFNYSVNLRVAIKQNV